MSRMRRLRLESLESRELLSATDSSAAPDLLFYIPNSDSWIPVEPGEYAYLSLETGIKAPKATVIEAGAPVYLNFVVRLSGSGGDAVPASRAEIYVDEIFHRAVIFPGLEIEPGYLGAFDAHSGTGIDLGELASGEHTVRIVLDADEAISESDETNNEHCFTVSVAPTETPAPDNLNGVQVGDGRVGLHWDAVDGAVEYRIYRKNDSGSHTLLDTTTGTTSLITDLSRGTATYVVSALFDGGRESRKTTEISVTVSDFDGPGAAPTFQVRDAFLIINGSADADVLTLRDKSDAPDFFQIDSSTETQGVYAKAEIKVVVFNGFTGNNRFDAETLNVDCIVHGGDGDDFIFGGAGRNFLDGGDGDNRIVGGTGSNVFYNRGSGSSLFVWRSETENDSWASGHSNDSGGKDDAQLVFSPPSSAPRDAVPVAWRFSGIVAVLEAVEYVYSVLGNFKFFQADAVNLYLSSTIPVSATLPTAPGTVWLFESILGDAVELRADLVRRFAELGAVETTFETVSWSGTSLKPGGAAGDFADARAMTSIRDDWAATVEFVLARAADPENATEVWHEKVGIVHGFLNSLIGEDLFGRRLISVATDSLKIDVSDGEVSLTEAILHAGKDTTIVFDEAVAAVVLDGSAVSIDKSLTIDGGVLTIDGNARSGLLEIRRGNVILRNLTLTGAAGGSALLIDRNADLTLLNVLLTGNSAEGGVIENRATTSLINSLLVDNNGAAIDQRTGTTTISSSTITGNGGIVVAGGTLIVDNSVLAKNAEAEKNDLSVVDGSVFVNASLIGFLSSRTGMTIADDCLIGTSVSGAIDPKFADRDAGDLSLAADSPAIGAGDLSRLPEWITTDFSGLRSRIRDGMLDMGAHQSSPAQRLAAPTDFRATDITSNSLELRWTPVAGATGYRIQRSLDGTNWRTVKIVDDGASASANQVGLDSAATYFFRIVAFDAAAESPPAMLPDVGTVLTKRRTPNDFRGIGLTNDSATLAWTDSDGESGYALEYRKESDAAWISIPLPADTSKYTVAGLDPSTSYVFRLKANAVIAAGDSAYTPIVSLKTDDVYEANNSVTQVAGAMPGAAGSPNLGVLNAPITISDLVLADGNDYFRFQLPVGARAGSFLEIVLGETEGSPTLQLLRASGSVLASSTGTGNVRRIDLSSCSAGVYYLRVYGASTSEYTLTIDVPVVPSVPDGLTFVSATTDSVSLAWNEVGEATGYRLEYSVNGTNWHSGASIVEAGGTISGLRPATVYFFRVVALNDGILSAPTDGALRVATKLGAPENIVATATASTSVTLSWSKVDGANEYILEYGVDGLNWFSGATVSGTAASRQQGTLDGLDPATTYFFRITARKNTIQSASVPDSTWTTMLDAVTGATVSSRTTDSVTLSWNTVPGAGDYRLEYKRSSAADGTWIVAPAKGTTHGGDAMLRTVDALDSGERYDFRITAIKDAVESRPVTLSEIPTRLETPPGLTVLESADTRATVSWTAVSNAFLYEIACSTDGTTWKTPLIGVIEQDGSTRTATISSLKGDTAYEFRIRALSSEAAASSEWSASVAVKTMVASPLNFTAIEVTATTASFTWTRSVASASYRLEYATDGVNWTVGASLGNVPGGTITGLVPETTYFFRLFTVGDTESAPVSLAASTLPSDVPAVSVGASVARTNEIAGPGTPAIVRSDLSDGVVRLQWTDLGPDRTYLLFKNGVPVLRNVSETSYVDTNLSRDNIYVVYAYDRSLRKWSWSPQKVVSTGPVKAEISSHEILPSGGIRLNWTGAGTTAMIFRDNIPVSPFLSDSTWTDLSAPDGEIWYVLYVSYRTENGRSVWTRSDTYVVEKNISGSPSLFDAVWSEFAPDDDP